MNTSFNSISLFLRSEAFTSSVGDLKSMKKLRSADLLIEVSSDKQAILLISSTDHLGAFIISVTVYGSLNSSRGVISEPDLLYNTEAEIFENLRDQHVCVVRRITTRKNEKFEHTKHLIHSLCQIGKLHT